MRPRDDRMTGPPVTIQEMPGQDIVRGRHRVGPTGWGPQCFENKYTSLYLCHKVFVKEYEYTRKCEIMLLGKCAKLSSR